MKIRIVLAEDQAMVRGALVALLELESDLEVATQAADGEQALAAVAEHDPDVLLAEIEMPGMTGLELAARVQREHSRTRVIVLTTFVARVICAVHSTPVSAATCSKTPRPPSLRTRSDACTPANAPSTPSSHSRCGLARTL